jgi:multicomponent Na+:H+ antiporter subunit D
MTASQPMLCLLILLPALLPLALTPCHRSRNLRETVSFVAGLLNLALVIFFLSAPGPAPGWRLGELLPGVPFSLRLDGLSALLLITAGLLWPLATLYSAGYLRQTKENNQTRFFCAFGMAIAATNGVALAGNLLTLYMFYEVLSLSTYPLVIHQQTLAARSAGRRYLTFLMGGSVGLALPALLTIYTKTGSLDFGAGLTVWRDGGWPAVLLTLAFLYGFGKAAVMPMHAWLPGAMVAPTPVSSLLHAVAVVKVGVFSVIRATTEVLGPGFLIATGCDHLVTALCTITVLVSAALMLSQDNLKRCLAFSTIGQLSYILLAVSLLNRDGLTGGALHIVMHAFGKITLFFCAGAIACHSGKKYISELDGLGRAMPWTFGAFTIGALAIIGLPPTGGFLSKWLIVTASLKAGAPLLAGLLLVSSLLKAFAFFPIIFRAFALPPKDPKKQPKGDVGWLMRLPLLATAAGSVLLFFLPGPFLALARSFADQILSYGGLP